MELHVSTSIRTRHLSRRDHVLNLLPPLTVENKEVATMHERLFADNPPQKKYPEKFPSKVLRHLGAWTFYSAPTKGELALLDKSMYELASDKEKTSETDGVKKTEKTTQSHYASDGKKKLETSKGKSLKANKGKRIQREEEKTLDKEANVKIEQKKSALTSKFTNRKCIGSNSLQNTKQPVSVNKNNNNIEDVKRTMKRHSVLKRASNKQQKNPQVNSMLLTPVANIEITLKKSRGKVLGGAETGAEIGTETLAVEGHNMSVPGPHRNNGKSHKGTRDTLKATREYRESIPGNATEQKDGNLRKARQNFNVDMYAPVSFDKHRGKIGGGEKTRVDPENTQLKNIKHSVIKIPLQENESPEENYSNKIITPHTEDLNSPSKVDNRESDKISENAMNHEVCSENVCSKPENDVLHDKHLAFGVSCEKEPVNKKRPKSQTMCKKGKKQSVKKQN